MKFNSDRPTKAIVAGLRERGVSVFYWRAVSRTKGVPDLICGYMGVTYFLEVKSPTGKLSESQEAWHAAWKGGPTAMVRTLDEALVAIGVETAF